MDPEIEKKFFICSFFSIVEQSEIRIIRYFMIAEEGFIDFPFPMYDFSGQSKSGPARICAGSKIRNRSDPIGMKKTLIPDPQPDG